MVIVVAGVRAFVESMLSDGNTAGHTVRLDPGMYVGRLGGEPPKPGGPAESGCRLFAVNDCDPAGIGAHDSDAISDQKCCRTIDNRQ